MGHKKRQQYELKKYSIATIIAIALSLSLSHFLFVSLTFSVSLSLSPSLSQINCFTNLNSFLLLDILKHYSTYPDTKGQNRCVERKFARRQIAKFLGIGETVIYPILFLLRLLGLNCIFEICLVAEKFGNYNSRNNKPCSYQHFE